MTPISNVINLIFLSFMDMDNLIATMCGLVLMNMIYLFIIFGNGNAISVERVSFILLWIILTNCIL
jgi:hypothetical protein